MLWTVLLGLILCPPARCQTSDNFNPSANNTALALAVQADGKIVVGGMFTQIGGQSRGRIARLLADGTVDVSFSPVAGDTVQTLAIQPDGRILVGGNFTALGGYSRTAFGRLNTNGTLDTSFTVPVSSPPPGYSQTVTARAILVQSDGKIVVGGQTTLTSVGGTIISGYAGRVNTNGTWEDVFTLTGGVNGPVAALALQADGKILVGGLFTTLRNQTRNRLGRLNSDGTLNTNFNVSVDGGVFALAVQADGRILVGGSFNTVAGQARTNLARLYPNGTLDGSFDTAVSGSSSIVYSLAVQTDGKILVGGLFSKVAGQSHANLARLNPEGTLDQTFTATANSYVYSLAVQADGLVLAGGQFGLLGGQLRSYVGRLNNTEAATQSLSDDGTTITWLRGGTSPEAWRTTFEVSTNLVSWSYLGNGVPMAGGWQLMGLSLPASGRVRARGYTSGGSSTWFVETIGGPCFLLAQPVGRTNNAGTTATFTARVNGSPPLSYRWLKHGNPLADGTQVSGSETATLNLSSVFGADADNYSVIISNSFGSVTSAVAVLKVIDPVITSTLSTNSADMGSTITTAVSATGTPPLSYQWRKYGTNLPGTTAASLILTNLQAADMGTYGITVSNQFGSVTSNRMVLEVNLAMSDNFLSSLDGAIYGIAEQSDGKLIVSGSFANVDGQAWPGLARLNRNGVLDTTFDPGTNFTGLIFALSIQADGKILVAGGFMLTQSNQTRYNIVRLRPDGSLDASFDPQANNSVLALAEQKDGKILVGGWLTSLGGMPHSYLGRINPDGTLDTNFNPIADYEVRCLAVQPDEKILVVGGFTHLSGQWRDGIGRLNPDGTADLTFKNIGDVNNPGANGWVNCVGLQADGKILLGGDFTTLGGVARKYIGRLNADGTLDTSFNPVAEYYANGTVYSIAVQADGKILVGGVFTGLGGKLRYYLGRLLPNGTADPTFNSAISHNLYVPMVSVGALADGKTIVAGSFTSLGGASRTNLALLNQTEAAAETLTFDGSSIKWLRNRTGPEVSRVSFDSSTNNSDWEYLGEGTRITGGWQLNGVTASVNTFLRARGTATGGYYSSSSWCVGLTLPVDPNLPPKIVTNEENFGFGSNQFGFTVAGLTGQTLVIETATNLVNWMPLTTNTLGTAPLLFVDPSSTNFTSRFYRARLH